MNWFRSVLSWAVGEGEAARVRWNGTYEGIVMHVPLGDGPPNAVGPAELVVSEVYPPTRVLEIAAFCQRRRLPIDAWVISGLDGYGGTPWQLGQWIGALACCQPTAQIVLLTQGLSGEAIQRLETSLKQAGVMR
jgi:hypothetical protein